MKYKVLAVDLDGTLLATSGEPHPVDRDALLSLGARGVATTIITGRLWSGTRDAALAIGAHGPVGCVDGSHIVLGRTGEDVFHAGITGDHAEALRQALAPHDAATFLFAHDEIIHDDVGAPYLRYVQTWSKQVTRIDRATEHPHWTHPRGVSEVVCVGHEESVRAIERTLGERCAEAVQVVSFPIRRPGGDGRWGMVVRAKGPSKGTAVEALARHHGVTPAEVVVVGDWLNDLSMFAVAGRSFAMGQAPEPVKMAATDVLDATNLTGGGIYEAARRAGLLP